MPYRTIDERAGESPQILKPASIHALLSRLDPCCSSRERASSGMICCSAGWDSTWTQNMEIGMESSAAATRAATTKQVSCNGLVFPLLTWGRPKARPVLLLHGFPQEPFTCPSLVTYPFGRSTILPSTPPSPSISCARRACSSGSRCAIRGLILASLSRLNSVSRSWRNQPGLNRIIHWIL